MRLAEARSGLVERNMSVNAHTTKKELDATTRLDLSFIRCTFFDEIWSVAI